MYLIVRWAEGLDEQVGAMMYVRDTIAPLLSIWTLLVLCLVGALLVFHLFLMSRSQTTNEFLRGVRPVNR
jgi:type VI protein secretion system component VasF